MSYFLCEGNSEMGYYHRLHFKFWEMEVPVRPIRLVCALIG